MVLQVILEIIYYTEIVAILNAAALTLKYSYDSDTF